MERPMQSYTLPTLDNCEEHGFACAGCRIVNGLDLPVPNDSLSIEDITDEARRCSAAVLKDFVTTNAIVKRFELTIYKRWKKKNIQQRKDILLRVWPEISRTHRPDFASVRQSVKKAKSVRISSKEAWLWPHLNLEDLVKGHVLLVLVNSRGRNFPAVFFHQDLQAARRGHGWPQTVTDNEDAMVIGGKSPRKYAAITNVVEQLQVGPERRYPPIVGLFVLQVQEGLYAFVKNLCMALLHDFSYGQMILAPSTTIPEEAIFDKDADQWASLPALSLEAPYRAPQDFDLSRLKSLINAKSSEAEDHVWSLREDPSYFVTSMREWFEHGCDRLSPRDEQVKERCWRHVAGRGITEAFAAFFIWRELDMLVSDMDSVQEQVERADRRSGRLLWPDEIFWALLEELLDHTLRSNLTLLKTAIRYGPRLRATFSDAKRMLPTRGLDDAAVRIHTVFRALFDEDPQNVHGIHYVIQEIQYMIDTDKAVNSYLDGWILEIFSDLALVSELYICILGFDPWQRGWCNAGVANQEPVASRLSQIKLRDEVLDECFFLQCDDHFPDLGVPTDGRFAYPSEKKRTKDVVVQMRNAEYRLDCMWTFMLDTFTTTARFNVWGAFQRLALHKRELYRTPMWTNESSPEHIELQRSSTELILQQRTIDLWDHGSPLLKDNARHELGLRAARVKPKTRPYFNVARPDDAADAEPAEDIGEEENVAPTQIRVSKRVHKILTAILPSGGEDYVAPREVAWNDFLYAMNAIGLVPEKLYGSVWIFRPTSPLVEMKRSIQFHEPKEVRRGQKMAAFMARQFGRRLKHAYGWTGEMFVSA